MNQALLSRLRDSLHAHREAGLYRQRPVWVDNKVCLNFSSNDYLSLTSDPRLKQAYQTGYALHPVGSGGSPLVSGYRPVHRQLEDAFSAALGVDNSLFFSSGYAANLSLMALLVHLDVSIFIDKSIHASVYDGMTGAEFKRYRHCDTADLTSKLLLAKEGVVLTESIFSMSGQVAPLAELAALSAQQEVDLFVDEAHAFGLIGREGLGLVNALNLTQHQVPLRVIPLGKAFAGSGAIIAGQEDWINALLQSARSYIYSTAPSPALAYGLLKTLDVVRAADERRRKLVNLIAYFREAITHSPLTWRDSATAIQQLQLGCPHRAQAVSEQLFEKDIICHPMRHPTVTKQETGLRVILNYHHQPEDIDYLFRCLHT